MKGHRLQYCVLWWESLPCWMGNPGQISPCVAVISYIIIPVSWLIMDFVQSPWVMWEELSFLRGCLMKESSLSLPLSTLGEKTELTLPRIGECHWQALSSLLLIKTWTPLSHPIQECHFLFGCSGNIERQYERSECLSRSTFSSDDWEQRKRTEGGQEGGQKLQQRTSLGILSDLTNSSQRLHNRRITLV